MKYLLQWLFVAVFVIYAPASFGRTIATSETGIVFSDVECEIIDASVGPIGAGSFYWDEYDYLWAEVKVRFHCMSPTGGKYYTEGTDRVFFPTLSYSPHPRQWYADRLIVAEKLLPRSIWLNPLLSYTLWTDIHSSHASFQIEVKD